MLRRENHTLYALADFVLLRVELVVILTVSVVNDIDWSLRWCRYALSHSCRRDATRENAALGKRARRGDAGGFRAAFFRRFCPLRRAVGALPNARVSHGFNLCVLKLHRSI